MGNVLVDGRFGEFVACLMGCFDPIQGSVSLEHTEDLNVQAHNQSDNLDTPFVLLRIWLAPGVFRFGQDGIVHVEQRLGLRRPVWVQRDLPNGIWRVYGMLSRGRYVVERFH